MADERLWIYTIADSGITSRGVMLEPVIKFAESSSEGASPNLTYRSVLVPRGITQAMWYIDSEGSGTQNSRLVTMSPLSAAAPVLMTDMFPQVGDHYVPVSGSSLVTNSILFIRWTSGTGGCNGRGSLYIPTTYEELTGDYVCAPGCRRERPIFEMLTSTTGAIHQGTNIRIIENLGTPPTVTDHDLFSDVCTAPKIMAYNGSGRLVTIYQKPYSAVSGTDYYIAIVSISGITPSLVSETALSFVTSADYHLEHVDSSIYVYGQDTNTDSTGPIFRRIDASGATPIISVETLMFPTSFAVTWDVTTAEVFALVPLDDANVAIVYYIENVAATNAKIAVRTFNVNTGPREDGEVVVETDTLGNMASGGIHMALVDTKLIVSWIDRPTLLKKLSTFDVLT